LPGADSDRVQMIVSDKTPAVVIIRWSYCASSAPFESAADSTDVLKTPPVVDYSSGQVSEVTGGATRHATTTCRAKRLGRFSFFTGNGYLTAAPQSRIAEGPGPSLNR